MVNLLALLQIDLVKAGLIVAGSIVLAYLIHIILKTYIKSFAKRTKSDIDDAIVSIISKPLSIYIIIAGIYIALKTLSYISAYADLASKIFISITILFGAVLISRVLSFLISHWLKVHKRSKRAPRLLNGIVAMILYLIAFVMILGHFDIEITPLIATLGLGGLAIGLALQNTLTNLFAGLHIISDRPIDVGDFIEIEGGISGYVEDIGWRSTRIKKLSNTIVIIPNAKLAESTIINDSLPEKEMSLVVQVGVDYGSNLEKVEKVTIDVAKHIQKTVPGAVRTHEPFTRYHTFADSNINFSVILRVNEYVNKYLVTHEFIKALKARYDKEGIEISWPVRKVYQANPK